MIWLVVSNPCVSVEPQAGDDPLVDDPNNIPIVVGVTPRSRYLQKKTRGWGMVNQQPLVHYLIIAEYVTIMIRLSIGMNIVTTIIQ